MRQAMLSVYRNQTCGRVPVGAYTRYLPRSESERELRGMGLGVIEYQPPLTMIGPPWHLIDGFLSEITGAEISIRYRWENGRRIERRSFVTPVGEIFQDVVRDSGGTGSEHIVSYYIKSREDYRVLTYLFRHTVIRSNEDLIKSRQRLLGDDGIVLGRMDRSPYQKMLIEFAGAERFLIDLYTDPEPAMEAMASAESKMDEVIERAMESSVEVVWLPDNVTADMTPPEAFDKFVASNYQRWVAACTAGGKPLAVHMDGRVKPLVPAINAIGVPVVESLSLVEIGGDLGLREAQDSMPNTVIIPNIPSNWALLDDDEVLARFKSLLAEADANRPLMVQFSEDLPESEWQRVFGIIVEFMHQ